MSKVKNFFTAIGRGVKKAVLWAERILNKFLPRYAYIPVLSQFLFNTFVYSGTKALFIDKLPADRFYDLSIWLDDVIPFVPCFIFFYILSYPQWFFGWCVNTRASREVCYNICMGDIIAKAICLVFFLAMPTMIQRGEYEALAANGSGLWNYATNLIYLKDTPNNLFPSVHCLESWIVFRGATMFKGAPKWYVVLEGVFSLGVFLSTVFVKQHFVVDIFAGIAAAELGIFLSKKLHIGRFVFEKIQLPFARENTEMKPEQSNTL